MSVHWVECMECRDLGGSFCGGCHCPCEWRPECRESMLDTAIVLGERKPWRWSELPGLDYMGAAEGSKWCRAAFGDFVWTPLSRIDLAPWHPRLGAPYITSERRPERSTR